MLLRILTWINVSAQFMPIRITSAQKAGGGLIKSKMAINTTYYTGAY